MDSRLVDEYNNKLIQNYFDLIRALHKIDFNNDKINYSALINYFNSNKYYVSSYTPETPITAIIKYYKFDVNKLLQYLIFDITNVNAINDINYYGHSPMSLAIISKNYTLIDTIFMSPFYYHTEQIDYECSKLPSNEIIEFIRFQSKKMNYKKIIIPFNTFICYNNVNTFIYIHGHGLVLTEHKYDKNYQCSNYYVGNTQTFDLNKYYHNIPNIKNIGIIPVIIGKIETIFYGRNFKIIYSNNEFVVKNN